MHDVVLCVIQFKSLTKMSTNKVKIWRGRVYSEMKILEQRLNGPKMVLFLCHNMLLNFLSPSKVAGKQTGNNYNFSFLINTDYIAIQPTVSRVFKINKKITLAVFIYINVHWSVL